MYIEREREREREREEQRLTSKQLGISTFQLFI